ncbi:hypothetical protein [Budvicia aquatica]|uniref:hypothetical protein n=1 Tax=Budvicia aquatica TaxID=82979 RepID=UPI0021C2967E|nr:hypothetical protein [Budvicia aquatica]
MRASRQGNFLVSAGNPQANADEHHAYHVDTFQYDSAGNRISSEDTLNNAAVGIYNTRAPKYP